MKYEYNVKELGTTNLEEMLNELGAEGWELSGVLTHTMNAQYVFKRELLKEDKKEESSSS